MDFSDMLTCFGLTRQEALIYLTLYSESMLTGYEVSKHCGISRSNSYTSLASLVDKGAAYIVEDSATRYMAVRPDEFCGNKIRKLKMLKQELSKLLPCPQNGEGGYITIKGEQNIMDKMINMIISAHERIYISVNLRVLTAIKPYLEESVQKKIKVVIITNPPFESQNALLYMAKQPLMQIRLITDSSEILTGDLSDTKTCLYSQKKNLVDLFKYSMKNEIRLIELGEL